MRDFRVIGDDLPIDLGTVTLEAGTYDFKITAEENPSRPGKMMFLLLVKKTEDLDSTIYRLLEDS